MKRLLTKPALLGFTLIELIIVIVILGILVAAAIPKYKDLQYESKVSSTFGSLSSLRSGTSIFIAKDATHAPPAVYVSAGTALLGTTGSECTECTGGTTGTAGTVDFFPKYVQKIPTNEILTNFGGSSTDASEIRVHSNGGILASSSLMLGTAACPTWAAQIADTNNHARATSGVAAGMVTRSSGWFYVYEPAASSGGGGGEGFAWGINIGARPSELASCFYEK